MDGLSTDINHFKQQHFLIYLNQSNQLITIFLVAALNNVLPKIFLVYLVKF